MKFALLVLISALIIQHAAADTWKFAVMGDDRLDWTKNRPGDNPVSGINEPVLKAIVADIQSKNPEFVLVTGDLVAGSGATLKKAFPNAVNLPTSDLSTELGHWVQLVSPLKCPVLPVRGNHETIADPSEVSAAWLNNIRPLLDSANVSFFPREAGFSFSYIHPKHRNIMVIGLDDYINGKELPNLGELENRLRQAQAAKAIPIVFDHEMAFFDGHHTDNLSSPQGGVPRDTFVGLLQKYGCSHFFSGHDHFYDWMQVTKPTWGSYVLNQYVAGTSGAPPYPVSGYAQDAGYVIAQKDHKDNVWGYNLVTVDDSNNNIAVEFVQVSVR